MKQGYHGRDYETNTQYYSYSPQACALIVAAARAARVRKDTLPAVGVAGLKSLPLARRAGRHSNIRWNAYVRHTGRILSIGAPAARAYSPDQPWVDMWRRIAGGLLEVHRCLRWSGASLHSHTYNDEIN